MGWLRLDDHYDDHPKIVAAGAEAAWLDVRGMLFCARHETDGAIPHAQLARIGSDFTPKKRAKLAGVLVEVGRWTQTETGFLVNDFLDYNPAASVREAEREAARERMKKARRTKGARSGEQQTNGAGTSGNPDPTPPLSPPNPPPSGGNSRANGTNPRTLAAQREAERLRQAIRNCQTEGCDHTPLGWNRLCGTCSGLVRKLGELVA